MVSNPVIGESLTLSENKEINIGYRRVFLGFHPETKEYKVICFFAYSIRPLLGQEGCEVYTLGANNWRPICNPHHYLLPCHHPAPAIVNGTVYWLTSGWEDNQWKHSLLSFDLKAETFARILLPNYKIYKGKGYEISHNLVELQGNVFLTVTPPKHHAPRPMDIWMLTANNDGGNITKYEWALKYSLLFPIGVRCISTLLIHNEKILVHAYKSNSAELIYCHLNSKGQGHELFYRKEVALNPRMYDYLKSEYDEDIDYFHYDDMFRFEPFVHINNLVSLRSN